MTLAQEAEAVDLVAAIEAVRTQITEAVINAPDQRLQLEIGDIEMEFTVSMTRDESVKGGLKLWVLGLDGGRGTSAGMTHRIKLTLKANDTVTGRSPHVSDPSVRMPPR